MKLIKTLWLGILLSVPVQAEVAVPPLTGHVIDKTATLSITEQVGLEQTLKEVEAKKGSQIAVLIVPTTQPETIEQYSVRVAENWKLGRQKIDDGVLLLIAKNDRSLRIEVGYGLQGALNDATAKRIISEVITPHFQQGNFSGGIKEGITSIIKVIDGEPLPEKKAPLKSVKSGLQDYFPVLLIVALAVGGLLRAILGRVAGSFVTGGVIAVIVWFILGALTVALFAGCVALLFTLFGGSALGRGILLGGGGFGRGGFSGGGGGGFSGGGGGFGGGGASGKW